MNYYGEVLQKFFPDMNPMTTILEDTPFLRRSRAQESNAGDKHMYTELVSADPLKQVDVNEAWPEITAEFGEDYAEVNRFAGKHWVTEDTVLKIAQAKGRPGNVGFGINEYFRMKREAIQRQTAMKLEEASYYAANGIQKRGNLFGNETKIQTSGTDFYSLAVVGYNDHSSLLYDANFYGGANGTFMREKNLNAVNGSEIIPVENSSGVFVYGKAMQTSLGNFFVDEKQIATIINFKLSDIDAAFFQIVNDQILKVRSNDKVIVAHPNVIARLNQAEEAKGMGVGNAPSGINGTDNNVHMGMWRSVGMVGTYNLSEGKEKLNGGL